LNSKSILCAVLTSTLSKVWTWSQCCVQFDINTIHTALNLKPILYAILTSTPGEVLNLKSRLCAVLKSPLSSLELNVKLQSQHCMYWFDIYVKYWSQHSVKPWTWTQYYMSTDLEVRIVQDLQHKHDTWLIFYTLTAYVLHSFPPTAPPPSFCTDADKDFDLTSKQLNCEGRAIPCTEICRVM